MDRVLEIGGSAAGFCGRLFAQCGHDVVRVESNRTDLHSPSQAWVSEEAIAVYLHAGKRRVRTDDHGLMAALAEQADVAIVEADTARNVEALGFDEWPASVKVAITPFGRTGPKNNWQATSNTILAMGGHTHLMGDPTRAPLSLPGHYAEFQSGGFAFIAANACRLAKKTETIDIGMLEVVMALSQFTTVLWHCAGVIRSRHGNHFWPMTPANLFRCADGWVYINIVPAFWDPFVVFLNKPELLIDERFVTNEARRLNRDALHALIADALLPLTKARIARRAEECRVPLGVVQSLDDVLADAHLAERDMWQSVRRPTGPTVRSPRPSWRVADEPWPELALADPTTHATTGSVPVDAGADG